MDYSVAPISARQKNSAARHHRERVIARDVAQALGKKVHDVAAGGVALGRALADARGIERRVRERLIYVGEAHAGGDFLGLDPSVSGHELLE